MDFTISASTDAGIKRRVNEDSVFACKIKTEGGNMVFAALCDGMGGLSNGAFASATVLDAFIRWAKYTLPVISRRDIPDHMIIDQWSTIIETQNEKLRSYGRAHGVTVGTTAVALLLTERRYYIVNIGDSRAYVINGDITQLTTDHSLVAREVSNGNITATQAEQAPGRNILTQCVGGREAAVAPDIYMGRIDVNTVYMLCSDGLRHKMSSRELYEYLKPSYMNNACEMKSQEYALIDCNKLRGETDNISIITIRTGETTAESPSRANTRGPERFTVEEEIIYAHASPWCASFP